MTESSSTRVHNRWATAVAGVITMMMLGTVYAWSVFKKPLAGHGWQPWEVGLTFTLMIFFLGFSAAMGGRLVDRAGARKVASVAGVLFGLGTLLAGLGDTLSSKWVLWIGYGVLGGIGNGLGYITPVAVLVRWFPDKRGTITGLAVMGFGLGAAVMGQIAPLLIPAIGIDRTFYLSGAIFLVGLLAAARYMVNPPAGWAPPAVAVKTSAASVESVDVKRALSMYQFYVLWGLLFLNVTAGIAIISNLANMAQDQLKIDPVLAGTIVLASSLCNGFGRLFWAYISEKIGRKGVFLLLFATQVPLFLLLPHIASFWLFTAAACYILLCYGGGFGTMPSFTVDTFGPKSIGGIYGKILFAWGLAGFVGPMLMEWIKTKSSSFSMALYIAAAFLAAGFLLTLAYRRPATTKPEAK